MTDKPHRPLIRQTNDPVDGSFEGRLLEQYKVYVQSADNVSERRVASVRYLLTVNVALVAAYGFQSVLTERALLASLIALAGIVLSLLSYSIIKSFRDLNTAKFEIIHELEEHLPAAPYAYEWQLLEEGRGKAYRPTTHVEKWMPLVFLAIHALALVASIYFAACGLPDWLR